MKKVKCVDVSKNGGVLRNLTQGKVYDVVKELPNDYVVIDDKGRQHEYYKNRFVDVTPERAVIKQVICVDAYNEAKGKYLKNLTEGEVYSVVEEKENDYIVIDDKGNEHEYFKDRFEDVSDDNVEDIDINDVDFDDDADEDTSYDVDMDDDKTDNVEPKAKNSDALVFNIDINVASKDDAVLSTTVSKRTNKADIRKELIKAIDGLLLNL